MNYRIICIIGPADLNIHRNMLPDLSEFTHSRQQIR